MRTVKEVLEQFRQDVNPEDLSIGGYRFSDEIAEIIVERIVDAEHELESIYRARIVDELTSKLSDGQEYYLTTLEPILAKVREGSK